MNRKIWFGLLLLVASYAQLLFPRRLFTHPGHYFYGYPFVPGNILAITATLFALGVTVLGEGVCQRFGAPSLWHLATRDKQGLVRLVLAATGAGLLMELLAQWLGKLWIYPYWTPWFYGLVLIPGFVFYWISIVESYLALKAVLDSSIKLRDQSNKHHFASLLFGFLGVLGAVLLLVAVWLYVRWYAVHGGYVFAATVAVRNAPPFGYVLLAFLGAWCVVEWVLRHRGSPSLVSSALHGYWTPAAAVAGSSLLLSFAMEIQNDANQYWAYTHFPGPDVTFLGVQVSVLATWPLQYIAFLLFSSLFVPALAPLFWHRQ